MIRIGYRRGYLDLQEPRKGQVAGEGNAQSGCSCDQHQTRRGIPRESRAITENYCHQVVKPRSLALTSSCGQKPKTGETNAPRFLSLLPILGNDT